MTPEEKWGRLQNPQSVEDYGLSVTVEELESFEAGREVAAAIRWAHRLLGKSEPRCPDCGLPLPHASCTGTGLNGV